MEILYLLVPLSLLLVFVIAGIFWWSLRSGQFEDLEGPAYRVLMDDDDFSASDEGLVQSIQSVDIGQRSQTEK